MQTTPAPPGPAPVAPTRVIVTTGTPPIPITAPRTVQELEGLRARRSELSTQMNSAANRRERLAREASRTPPGPARMGLEQRVAVLDQRMVQIESDMAETGRQLSTTQAGILSNQAETSFGYLSRSEVQAVSSLFILFVLAPLALAGARNMWKRGSRPAPLPPDLENTKKMEQLQQSIDTIAVEMERVSEGQRFVTKLLSEQPRSPVIASANQTVLQQVEQQR